MRRWLIRGVLIPGALVFLAGLWFFTSRWCALAVDQVYTPRLALAEAAPIGWNGTWLQLGTGIFDRLVPNGDHLGFTGFAPDYQDVARFIVDADDRLVFVKDDARFVLGPRAGTLPASTQEMARRWRVRRRCRPLRRRRAIRSRPRSSAASSPGRRRSS